MATVVRVLFVCHANLCRSPIAHALLVQRLQSEGLTGQVEVDSAGTWAMDGAAPHPEAVSIATRRHLDLSLAGRSRSIEPADLQRFDEVLAIDRRVFADLTRLRRLSAFGVVEGAHARLRLARHVVDPDLVGRDSDILDPLGRSSSGFEDVFEQLEAVCDALMKELRLALE